MRSRRHNNTTRVTNMIDKKYHVNIKSFQNNYHYKEFNEIKSARLEKSQTNIKVILNCNSYLFRTHAYNIEIINVYCKLRFALLKDIAMTLFETLLR